MIAKTKGIIFRRIKYGESSLILDIFTLDYGLESYIVGGVRKPRSRISSAVMQLMSVIDFVSYRKPTNTLIRIRDARLDYVFQSIPFNTGKGAILIFLAELCSRSIRTAEANPALFQFLRTRLEELDQMQSSFANFHLEFMISLADFLGFSPQPNYDARHPHFDLMEGTFISDIPHHQYYVRDATLLGQFIQANAQGDGFPGYNRKDRAVLLDQLILFYRLHVDGMPELKSHKILREVI